MTATITKRCGYARTVAPSYAVRPDPQDENLWQVEPADSGLSHGELNDEFLVFWGSPVPAGDGTSFFHAMTWEYWRSEDDGDYILA